jgi:hypothetical protein
LEGDDVNGGIKGGNSRDKSITIINKEEHDMKEQKKNYWKGMLVLLALLALSVFLSATETVFAYDGAGIGITPEVTARWWQWVFSMPSSVHPLSQKNIDSTGADYCMVGQRGDVWFLGGVFKTVDVTPANVQTQSNDIIEIVRECHDIPLGKTILIPVLNGECNTAEELALGNDVPENIIGKTRYLRNCAKTLADAISKETAKAYFGPVDSKGNWTQKPVEVKRIHTVLPFSITYSPDNILSSNCGTGDAFLCTPNPNPSLAQADGYWAQALPPKPGTYKLQTFGEAPDFDFALRITYTLTVVGPQDQ